MLGISPILISYIMPPKKYGWFLRLFKKSLNHLGVIIISTIEAWFIFVLLFWLPVVMMFMPYSPYHPKNFEILWTITGEATCITFLMKVATNYMF